MNKVDKFYIPAFVSSLWVGLGFAIPIILLVSEIPKIYSIPLSIIFMLFGHSITKMTRGIGDP